MKARVVTPKAGVRVDGKNGGDNLGGQKKQNGDVERGFGDLEFMIEKGFDEPDGADDNSQQIDEHHFVELKDLGSEGPEDEGSEKK
jgi:hypothetical protein